MVPQKFRAFNERVTLSQPNRGVNAIGALVAFCRSLTSEDFSLAIAEAGREPPRENRGEKRTVGQGVGASAAEGSRKQDQTLTNLVALWPTLSRSNRQDLLRQAKARAVRRANARNRDSGRYSHPRSSFDYGVGARIRLAADKAPGVRYGARYQYQPRSCDDRCGPRVSQGDG